VPDAVLPITRNFLVNGGILYGRTSAELERANPHELSDHAEVQD